MMAGHDINYIALSGVLSMVGRPGGAPVPPLNLVGDFGGGGMMLAFGMVCAMLESRRSGVGQVVDGAMIDGSALLATMFFEMMGRGMWSGARGTNALDGGAPYYDSYETSDGKWVAVGAVESQFWAAFVELLDIGGPDLPEQMNQATWPDCARASRQPSRSAPATNGVSWRPERTRASRPCSHRSKLPTIPTTGSVPATSWWATPCSHPPPPVLPLGAEPAHPAPRSGPMHTPFWPTGDSGTTTSRTSKRPAPSPDGLNGVGHEARRTPGLRTVTCPAPGPDRPGE